MTQQFFIQIFSLNLKKNEFFESWDQILVKLRFIKKTNLANNLIIILLLNFELPLQTFFTWRNRNLILAQFKFNNNKNIYYFLLKAANLSRANV